MVRLLSAFAADYSDGPTRGNVSTQRIRAGSRRALRGRGQAGGGCSSFSFFSHLLSLSSYLTSYSILFPFSTTYLLFCRVFALPPCRRCAFPFCASPRSCVLLPSLPLPAPLSPVPSPPRSPRGSPPPPRSAVAAPPPAPPRRPSLPGRASRRARVRRPRRAPPPPPGSRPSRLRRRPAARASRPVSGRSLLSAAAGPPPPPPPRTAAKSENRFSR